MKLSCPKCKRDYEVPKRYLLNLNDLDFSPVPRLLPCLHTHCHSCLEEQLEASEDSKIVCSECNHREVIKGVNYLPLDINVLKQIVLTTSEDIMAVCSRCYDAVPSVSWCESCSSALCEFHHQDHRLSIDTAKHCFYTFKDRNAAGLPVNFKFPPIPCPQVAMQDCDLYCHTCGYMVSAKAGLEFHKDHNLAAFPEASLELLDLVSASLHQNSQQQDRLREEISRMNDILSYLESMEESNVNSINKVFNLAISNLKQRRKELVDAVADDIAQQRQHFQQKLASLESMVAELKRAHAVASGIVSNTNNKVVPPSGLGSLTGTISRGGKTQRARAATPAGTTIDILDNDFNHVNNIFSSSLQHREEEVQQLLAQAQNNVENMYLIASAEYVDFHIDGLVEQAEKFRAALKVPAQGASRWSDYGVRDCKVVFLPEHLSALQSLKHVFGRVEIEGKRNDVAQTVRETHKNEGKEGESEGTSISHRGGLSFSVLLDSDLKDSHEVFHHKDAATGRGRQVMVVQACEATDSCDGVLLGKVIMIEESAPDALLKKYKWKCSFDLQRDDDKPVLTIHKQIIPVR